MPKIWKFIRKNAKAWAIMLPILVLFAFYIWVPLFQNISLSFYKTVGTTKVKFVGLEQYRLLFQSADFLKALGNTFEYALWSLVIGFLLPIVIALILNEVVHLRGLFRTMIYFPNIVPGIAVAIMWTFLFDPNPYGVLNSLFKTNNLWLNNEKAVIPLIVFTLTWKGAGATSLIYLANLQTIDKVYYEAARLEGASAWQRFWHVTLPHLKGQIKLLLIVQIISVFQVFYEPLVMTKGGGPNGASSTLVQLIYQIAFEEFDAGKAAALSVIVALILFMLTGLYFYLSKERRKQHGEITK